MMDIFFGGTGPKIKRAAENLFFSDQGKNAQTETSAPARHAPIYCKSGASVVITW
jgi:hypothetical protein